MDYSRNRQKISPNDHDNQSDLCKNAEKYVKRLTHCRRNVMISLSTGQKRTKF
ncbi:hypothetical protein IMSAGC011_03468 [Lachnospiraceae bacterium]|nr:hypothetical protein IMSAGC011_03468 [Lachnospiraceae bacterium]